MAPICGPCLMSHMGLLIEPKETPQEFSPALPFWGHSDRPPQTKLGCDPPDFYCFQTCLDFKSLQSSQKEHTEWATGDGYVLMHYPLGVEVKNKGNDYTIISFPLGRNKCSSAISKV